MQEVELLRAPLAFGRAHAGFTLSVCLTRPGIHSKQNKHRHAARPRPGQHDCLEERCKAGGDAGRGAERPALLGDRGGQRAPRQRRIESAPAPSSPTRGEPYLRLQLHGNRADNDWIVLKLNSVFAWCSRSGGCCSGEKQSTSRSAFVHVVGLAHYMYLPPCDRQEVAAMPPPGGCARGGGQWAGIHGPPRSVPARRVEEDNGTQ